MRLLCHKLRARFKRKQLSQLFSHWLEHTPSSTKTLNSLFNSLETALRSSRESLYRDTRSRRVRFEDEASDSLDVDQAVAAIKSDWLAEYRAQQAANRQLLDRQLEAVRLQRSNT